MNSTAERLIERETRVRYGLVPHGLSGGQLPEMTWEFTSDEFLFHTERGNYFYYCKGQGVCVEQGKGADRTEESLFLNGSVYAAIASLNGLMPVHASAIAFKDQVFAFTGPSGSGKSTIVAALGQLGFPMFCDDTLIIDLSDPNAAMCLPGHKRLKLTTEAIALTSLKPEEQVSLSTDKFYCKPPAGEVHRTLPLAQLIFLEQGYEFEIQRIFGLERFRRLNDDHYTADLYAAAQNLDPVRRFAHVRLLVDRIDIARFTRPLERGRFNQSVEAAARYIVGFPGDSES